MFFYKSFMYILIMYIFPFCFWGKYILLCTEFGIYQPIPTKITVKNCWLSREPGRCETLKLIIQIIIIKKQ